MADIGDVTAALLEDRGLIGGAPLQVVVAHEAHVHRLRRIADLGRFLAGLRHCQTGDQSERGGKPCARDGTATDKMVKNHCRPPDSRWPAALVYNGGSPAIARASPVNRRICIPVLARSTM